MKFFFLFFTFAAFACTDFVLKSADGTLVNGRSLEFAMDLQSKIQVFSRKMEVSSLGPNGEPGMQWVSQYGFLGVTAFGKNLTLDGMNEKGLSCGLLWMPTTQYQTISVGDVETPLDFVDLGVWILGNFASVAEVKEALKGVRVWGHPVPPLPGIPPLHIAIHDAMGNHLVVEFIKGKMLVYDNPNTVLTNYPPFDWMLINLQNYIHLSAFNVPDVKFQGAAFGQTGQGSGMLGLPGDWTPPSRFVRMTTFLRFAKQAENALEAINLAEHLLNTVDIPIGMIRERIHIGAGLDSTQWIVIKDLTNKVFYFRSYKDLALKSIDMKRVNFNPGSKGSVAIDMGRGYMDVTASLKNSLPQMQISDASSLPQQGSDEFLRADH